MICMEIESAICEDCMKHRKIFLFTLTLYFLILSLSGCANETRTDQIISDMDLNNVELYGDLGYEELTIVLPIEFYKKDLDVVISELNLLTSEKINTVVRFNYKKDEEMHSILQSGDCDIMYCNNSMMFSKNDKIVSYNSLPNYISQELIMDVTELLPQYAPNINEAFMINDYMDYTMFGQRIYGLPLFQPVIEMPVAMVRKALTDQNTEIRTMEDIYTLLENHYIKGNKYFFYSEINSFTILDIFSNAKQLYRLAENWDGYYFDEEEQSIVGFEDTDTIVSMEDYFYFIDKYGKNSSYEEAIKDKQIGVILTTVGDIHSYSESTEFDFYPLYQGQKFSFPYNSMTYLVVAQSSGKYERALILLDFLYSNKEAYDLVTLGIPGVHYEYKNGKYVNINPVTLLWLYNKNIAYRLLPDKYYTATDLYLHNLYIPDFFKPIYKDYEILKQYVNIIYDDEDIYGTKERNRIIMPFIFQNNKGQEKIAFYKMLNSLEQTTDRSSELTIATKNLLQKD